MGKESGLRWVARRTVRLEGKRYAPGAFVPMRKVSQEVKRQLIEEGRLVQVDKNGRVVGGEEGEEHGI